MAGNTIIVSCTGKVRHTTWGAAVKAAKRFNRRNEGEGVEPYRCRSCNWFHLGHPSAESVRVRNGRGMARVARAMARVESAAEAD